MSKEILTPLFVMTEKIILSFLCYVLSKFLNYYLSQNSTILIFLDIKDMGTKIMTISEINLKIKIYPSL